MRAVLVSLQIAVTMILLTGAVLMLRSLWKLESVPLGIQTDRVLAVHFVLGKQRYSREPEQIAFFSRLEERMTAVPGVQISAISDSVPPSGGNRARPLAAIAIEGKPRRPEGTGGMVAWRYITPGYFAALGIPIVRGRPFDDQDRSPNSYSVILSEGLAHQLLAGMGVLLAAVGPFGVMSFLVSQRTREIEVRLALGATPGGVLKFTRAHAARWTAAGLMAGGIGSLAVTRILRALLFQVEPADPAVVAMAVVLLSGVHLLPPLDRRAGRRGLIPWWHYARNRGSYNHFLASNAFIPASLRRLNSGLT